jgi:hypothetical protein
MTGLLWNAFEIAVNYYQGFIIAFFISKFLTPKSERRAKIGLIIFGVAGGTIVTILNYCTVFEGVGSVLYWLCFFAFSLIFFSDSVIKKLFTVTMHLLLVILITSVELNVVSSIKEITTESLVVTQDITRFWTLILIQITVPIVFLIVLKIYKFTNERFTFSDWFPIITVLCISFILVAVLHTASLEATGKQHSYINIAYFLVFIINLLVFAMIFSLLDKNRKLSELELLKIQKIYQQQYIDNANVQYDSIRKIRHDIKNQLSAVYGLMAEKEYDTAMEFIGKSTEILSNADTVVNTENRIVNAIMNAKLATASAYAIKVECLTVSDFSGIDEIDLCNLLSNTLENALLACIGIKSDTDKFIRVEISRENGIYTFLIKNSIESSVLESNPTLRTTKADKINHGLGTKIIEDIANKYNGRCDFYEIEKEFCCQIILRQNLTKIS